MLTLKELKEKWFLPFDNDENPLHKRHPRTEITDWTDGNKVEMLIDSNALIKHFYGCLEKMIRFMEMNKSTPNPPQIWIVNYDITNFELLGPGQGGEAYKMMLKAAQGGVKIYFLHTGHFSQRLRYLGKLWKIELKKFVRSLNSVERGYATLDSRTSSLWGVQHQKFYICFWPDTKDWLAVVSSAGFNSIDWDTPDHSKNKGPTHEFSVVVHGPAVRDIAFTFAERWNDRANINRTFPQITNSISIDFLNTSIPTPAGGTHSVQVLRTYPIHIKGKNKSGSKPVNLSYSWSHQGEFTIWGAYLQAIKRAKNFIYIEDQYFNSFILPPVITMASKFLRHLDLIYHLGKALERKVDVIVLHSGKDSYFWPFRGIIEHQKLLSLNYLYEIYSNALSNTEEVGHLVIRTLCVNDKTVGVHSKLMIVDDEFVLVGNANIGARSMTYDSEIHLGIVDEKGTLAREMRLEIWKEHLQLTEEESDERNPGSIINKLKDPKEGVRIFSSDKGPGTRRLRPINESLLKNPPNNCLEKFLMRTFAQPYAGPKWNEWKE